jgi:DNA mismatch endonuclease (patch repair protein)
MMSGIRSKDTRPEMLVRRFLHGRGLRFRLHDKNLPGTPDLVFARYRVVIFVHGCFWHRHEGCKHASYPGSNVDFWEKKFAGNIKRDRDAIAALTDRGWRVVVLWECGLHEADITESLDWLPQVISKGINNLVEWPPFSPGTLP